ncbi:hypothetical protein F5Y14DRAFT_396129 [Nemania sp. NC0429]|nr:hypothetical protein F5Y14DRAFT_396129 [Nemania sp. NC0429]
MQHAANTSQQSVPRGPGSLYTPSQSFSETGQALDSSSLDRTDKQTKEHEVAKSRLSDPKFNMRDYADPLLPRQHSPSQYYPRGVTAETEKRLLDLISKIQTGHP